MRIEDIKVGDVLTEKAVQTKDRRSHQITIPIGIPNDNIYRTGSHLFQLSEDSRDVAPFNYINIDYLGIPPDKLVIKEIKDIVLVAAGGGYAREGAYWSSTSPIYLIVPTREGSDKFINWQNEDPFEEVKE